MRNPNNCFDDKEEVRNEIVISWSQIDSGSSITYVVVSKVPKSKVDQETNVNAANIGPTSDLQSFVGATACLGGIVQGLWLPLEFSVHKMSKSTIGCFGKTHRVRYRKSIRHPKLVVAHDENDTATCFSLREYLRCQRGMIPEICARLRREHVQTNVEWNLEHWFKYMQLHATRRIGSCRQFQRWIFSQLPPRWWLPVVGTQLDGCVQWKPRRIRILQRYLKSWIQVNTHLENLQKLTTEERRCPWTSTAWTIGLLLVKAALFVMDLAMLLAPPFNPKADAAAAKIVNKARDDATFILKVFDCSTTTIRKLW